MGGSRHAGIVGGCCLAAVLFVAGLQVTHLGDLLDAANPQYNAAGSEGLLVAYALAIVALVGAAAFVGVERLPALVAAAAIGAALTLTVTVVLSGEAWSLAWAALTLAACWRVGAWLLGAAGSGRLARVAPVAWLAGVGAIGLSLLFLGRAGLLSWWTAGLPVLVLGVLGIQALARALADGAGASAWGAVTSARWAAAGAGVCLLTVALASIWTAAPELQYDALYFKEWLPSEWARTGEIDVETLRLHPYLNVWGFSQLLAVPGHTAGAEGVGRYMQWLALGGAAATIWWAARRSAFAPLAAAALALSPLLFWQATTAYDDGILTLAGLAMAVAVLVALREPEESAVRTGAVLGALAGVCLLLKIHLAPLALGLVVGWLVLRRGGSRLAVAATVVVAGLAVSATLLGMRWIDLGNPIMPGYNDIFESPYWLADSASGVAGDGGGDGGDGGEPLGPLGTLWETIDETPKWGWPLGAFGLLSLAVALALALGWRRDPDGRGWNALWVGVVVAAVAWYELFDDARYLLAMSAVSILILALCGAGVSPGARTRAVGLAALAATAVLLWPSTVAQFWNLPGRGVPLEAALGRLDDREYERSAASNRELIDTFDEHAPPGALAVSDAFERSWLTDGRDLAPFWELNGRLSIDGSPPQQPAETLREVREAGVGWVLGGEREGLRYFPYLRRMLAAYGKPVASSGGSVLYRLPPGPGG